MERFVGLELNSQLEVVEGEAVTAVAAEGAQPAEFGLEPNFPNPFNAETRIRFAVGEMGVVRLAIYNALGQRVRVLVEGAVEVGRYEAGWDGRDEEGMEMGSGVYFYRLQSAGRELTRSLVLVR